MGSVTQCLELSTGNMKCVAMILLAGASLSHSSTNVKVSAHDPQSGLPYSYSITTVDTVPTPDNMYGYPGLPYAAPATEEGGESDENMPVVPAPSGYPAYAGYHRYAGDPRFGYGGYQGYGYPGYPAGYPVP